MNEPGAILIVDDEEEVRTTLGRLLTGLGHQCSVAGDGREALARLGAFEYDVVLTDFKMPEMDGMALLDAIGAAGIDAVPILLTSYGEVANAVEAMKLGAFDFLLKPCDVETIQGVVQRAIRHRQAIRQARRMAAAADEWQEIFDAWPDDILILDPQMRVTRCNRAIVQRLGGSRDALTGRLAHDLVCARAHAPAECPFRWASARGEKVTFELHFPLSGLDFDVYSTPLWDKFGNPFASLNILRDVTLHKLAERDRLAYQHQLQSLAWQLSTTEDRERRRLAAILHDGIGQILAIMNIKLDALRAGEAAAGRTEAIDELRGLTEGIIETTRTLTFELSPRILYELGLESALTSLLEKMRKDHGLQFTYACEGGIEPLEDDRRIMLYQAGRELLLNAVKHARARIVEVNIQGGERLIRLSVRDDGAGCDPERLAPASAENRPQGFGLFHIRERLRQIGGGLELETAPGRGMRVTLTVPRNNQES